MPSRREVGFQLRPDSRLGVEDDFQPSARQLVRDWLRALFAQACGDDIGYREFADRYRQMAKGLGFEGHVAMGEAMA